MLVIQTFIVLAAAVGAAAFTITRTKITEPMRTAVKKRSAWFGNLVGCPYCTSHWLAAGATALYRPALVHLWLPLDLLVTGMAMVAAAALVVGIINWAVMR